MVASFFCRNSHYMKKRAVIISVLSIVILLLISAQLKLIIEGTSTFNTETGNWDGLNIARSSPTKFIFRNNLITSSNSSGYMLHAGDEQAGVENNNLDGQSVTGNRFLWIGKSQKSNTHALFTGYNINATIRYNYLEKVPSGIQMKANGMSNTSGGIAYNIVNRPGQAAIPVKGMKNVKIYNNVFFSDQIFYKNDSVGVWRGLIDIYANTDEGQNVAVSNSSGTKIKNNIFYTVHKVYNIAIYDSADLAGFESDYNIFYCEAGPPIFSYLGKYLNFVQWQALGFDTHSRVLNPKFIDKINFVPSEPLPYGIDLGESWQDGLSAAAKWKQGSPPALSRQKGNWQVGAIVLDNKTPVNEKNE
jgi:hypothetical protein